MQAVVDPVSGYSTPSVGAVDAAVPVSSAVSWPAIAAGTVVAAAASLVLVAVGAGAGFGALSPWPHAGATATEFTVMTAIGFIVVQWLSAGIGGYVTGRLRTRWATLHTHEVFFRDTAHGAITWATATLLVSAAAALVAASSAGAAAHGVSAAATAAASAAAASKPTVDAYDVDTLLRPQTVEQAPATEAGGESVRAQTTRILGQGLATGDVPAADQVYLTQVVAVQGHLSPADAKTRVDAAVAKVRADHDKALQAADTARKSAEAASLFTAFAMVLGAFIACIAAALGGRRRDAHA